MIRLSYPLLGCNLVLHFKTIVPNKRCMKLTLERLKTVTLQALQHYVNKAINHKN